MLIILLSAHTQNHDIIISKTENNYTSTCGLMVTIIIANALRWALLYIYINKPVDSILREEKSVSGVLYTCAWMIEDMASGTLLLFLVCGNLIVNSALCCDCDGFYQLDGKSPSVRSCHTYYGAWLSTVIELL